NVIGEWFILGVIGNWGAAVVCRAQMETMGEVAQTIAKTATVKTKPKAQYAGINFLSCGHDGCVLHKFRLCGMQFQLPLRSGSDSHRFGRSVRPIVVHGRLSFILRGYGQRLYLWRRWQSTLAA